MALFCATHVLLLALLFVSARFRMNVLPFLVVLAAYGAARLAAVVRARAWPAVAIQVMALVALLLVSNWKVGPMRQEPFADVYWTLGMATLEQGHKRRACRYLERAAYLERDREAAWWRHCSKLGRMPWRPGD